MKRIYRIQIFGILLLITACMKEDYTIEYQDNYPSKLAGNWVAFEFQGGSLEGAVSSEPYDLVTSLDPNRPGYMILDKLYGADVRVRAQYADSAFSITMGEQLEKISTNSYDIKYISINGYITSNPVLLSTLYYLASIYYEDMAFEQSDIKDLIFMRAGFYDQYKAVVDTVLILGYRKTGFEEITY
jgi:hypothetical protein